MASAMTGEFIKRGGPASSSPFSVIEQKGLAARLAGELKFAAKELTRDPHGFIRDLFTDEDRDARRRRLIYMGLTCAVAIYAALFVVMLVVGWPKALTPSEEENALKIDRIISFANDTEQPGAESVVPRGENGGGGGGGNQESMPASFGRAPDISAQQPLVTPTTHVPTTPPSLPVEQTIQGDSSLQPKFDATLPIGDPTGAPAPPSGGTGKGGGIGSGDGAGVGPDGGPGLGPGKGGNAGGRTAGSPDGTSTLPTDSLNWNDINRIPDTTPFRWISRPRPVVTPEALAKKVIGEVLLRATFNANGTISDIEVIRTDVPEMTESARESLERSTFRPATVKGVPVTVRRVPVRVSIHY
jgi:hypothetical protein